MKIFPAIDIKDKKCVRLIKGDFENKTEYEISPVEQAGKYKDNGFKNLHIVDLDGALTGDPINAAYAKEVGLINDHYPISELENEVLKLAKKIASKSNLTIKIGKKAFYKQLEMPLKKAYKYTSEVMTKNAMELDAEEGISAFLEKRKPNWKNK